MAFNPKMMAAMKMKEKQKTGAIPSPGKNPMIPQNIIKQVPNLVAASPMAPIANPMAPATTSMFKPALPGLPGAPKPPRFGGLRKKLGGF